MKNTLKTVQFQLCTKITGNTANCVTDIVLIVEFRGHMTTIWRRKREIFHGKNEVKAVNFQYLHGSQSFFDMKRYSESVMNIFKSVLVFRFQLETQNSVPRSFF